MLSIVIVVAGGVFGMIADYMHWIVHPSFFHLLGFTTGYLSCGAAIVSWMRLERNGR